MVDKRKLEAIIKKVEKPARYIGNELNSIVKDFSKTDVRFAFSYPDVYEVGMSHIGMHILYNLINSRENFLCERIFAPWPDMEEEMRKAGIPLYSLENLEEASNFDIWGFTLQYEMSYTNILNMMDLAGIPIHSKDRNMNHPLIVAGGPCAYNPEPLHEFIDIFIIGEGEAVNLELLDLFNKYKNETDRDIFLKEATKIKGIYVPKFYDEFYGEDGLISSRTVNTVDVPETVEKAYVRDLTDMYTHDKMLVSYIELVHDRVALEIFRGCTQGCRFCQAGMIYRPIREKSIDQIKNQALNLIDSTGYEDVSLSSLSSCDYSTLPELISVLLDNLSERKVGVSLPSLRLDTFSVDVLKQIERVRKTGLTFAPEAGTQRLRDVINKNITDEDIEKTISYIYNNGWSSVKLYFMIGLPTETMEDVMGIKDIAYKVKDMFFSTPKENRGGNLRVSAAVSCFVPKPFTPFQWIKQDSVEEFYKKIYTLKENIKDPKVKYNYHNPEISNLECILARGDRRVSKTIEAAWRKGAKFDGWHEYFNYDIWMDAVEESGINTEIFTKEKSLNEILPWDFIDIGVTKEYLKNEYKKATEASVTKDCRDGCNVCGIKNCVMWETV